MYFSPCVVVPLPAVSSSPVSVYATSYSQSVSASAQQHDAHYEQHRRKAAGGKKECPSPLLLFDRRTVQLTPAEHFRLGHGSCLRRYSVILHCFTLLYFYFNILTSSRKSNSIGRPVPMGVSSSHRHISPVSVTPGLVMRKRKNLSVAARFKWSRYTSPSPFGRGYTVRVWLSLAAFRKGTCCQAHFQENRRWRNDPSPPIVFRLFRFRKRRLI